MIRKIIVNQKRLISIINLEIAGLLFLTIFLGYLLYAHFAVHKTLKDAWYNRFESHLLADELRRSSDNLTKMARSYVVTGDPKFEQFFWDIVDIRDGKKPRPEGYDHLIFWNLTAAEKQSSLPKNGEKVSLEKRMQQAGYTQEEFALLSKAKTKSDQLVVIEERAMQAIKGSFQDAHGHYTIPGPPDPALARELVFGQEYHDAKKNIMLPVNSFLEFSEKRLKTNAITASQKADTQFKSLVGVSIAFVLWGALLFVTTRQYRRLMFYRLQKAINKQSVELIRRKQAERDARQAEKIITRSPAVVFLWRNEVSWPVDYVSRNVTALLGYSEEDFTSGKVSYTDIVHKDDLANVSKEIAAHTGQEGKQEVTNTPYRVVTSSGATKWIESIITIKRDENGKITHFQGILIDITDKHRTENLIKDIAVGVAPATGKEYLENLVLQITKTLGVKFAVISRVVDGKACKTLAIAQHGKIGENFTYNFKNTPCENVYKNGSSCYSSDVGLLFPEDNWLTTNNIEGYIGIPLRSREQEIIGLLVAMDDAPLRNVDLTRSLLEIFAARASAELERMEKENQLQLSANVLANITEGVVVTKPDATIVAVNSSTEKITGYSEEEIVGLKPNLWKSDQHPCSFYEEMWDFLLKTGHWHGEIWNRRKNGDIFPAKMTIVPLRDDEGRVTNYVAVFSDISQMKKSQEKMEYLAQYDQLTNLPNRRLLNDRLKKALSYARRQNESIGLLLLDLDNFKEVNDSLGHKSGDILLIKAAQRILHCVRESDTVARLGGDEFVVLLLDCHSVENVSRVTGKILEELTRPFTIQGHDVFVSASIGITMFPDDGQNAEVLLKNADTAMYHVKKEDKNNFQFFTDSMQRQILKRLEMVSQLRSAVEHEEFIIYYQPKLDLTTGIICGMEALVRWQLQDGSIIEPADFIPLAEETGIILPLGRLILQKACEQAQAWHSEGLDDLRLSVNLSAKQFQDESLIQTITEVIKTTRINPGSLELEITETTIMQDIDNTLKTLWDLREMGVLLSIDDFGTGYSSLNYLKKLPLDILKIDRSFVQDIDLDPNDRVVVEAIVSLSHHLKLKVVAEGVESKNHLDFLKKEKCHEVQGYFISKPLPAGAFKSFVLEYNSAHQRPLLKALS